MVLDYFGSRSNCCSIILAFNRFIAESIIARYSVGQRFGYIILLITVVVSILDINEGWKIVGDNFFFILMYHSYSLEYGVLS